MKTVFAKCHDYTYAYRLAGVTPGFEKQSFGRQLDDLKKIAQFKETAKVFHVGAKRRSTLAAVKEWVKDYQPAQFFAKWRTDSSFYKDDSVEVYYTTGE